MVAPNGPRPVIPPNPTPGGSTFPSFVKWGVALLVIGGIAEWLYKEVSPTSGYTLVGVVIFAYAATPAHVQNFNQFFKDVGIIKA